MTGHEKKNHSRDQSYYAISHHLQKIMIVGIAFANRCVIACAVRHDEAEECEDCYDTDEGKGTQGARKLILTVIGKSKIIVVLLVLLPHTPSRKRRRRAIGFPPF